YAKWKKKFFFDVDHAVDDSNEVELVQQGPGSQKTIGKVTVQFVPSQRNTPALFGTGLIDGIPERVLEEVAAEQAKLAAKQPADLANSRARQMLKMGLADSHPLPV